MQRAKFLRNLPEEEREAIEACFNSIDEDCSGSLSTGELGELLRHTYGMEPNREQLLKLKVCCSGHCRRRSMAANAGS